MNCVMLYVLYVGTEREYSVFAHYQGFCLLNDFLDCHCCLGCTYQVRACKHQHSRIQILTLLTIFHSLTLPSEISYTCFFIRLFQVIERIDDTLALLNLVRAPKKLTSHIIFLFFQNVECVVKSSFYSISGLYDAYNLPAIHSELCSCDKACTDVFEYCLVQHNLPTLYCFFNHIYQI